MRCGEFVAQIMVVRVDHITTQTYIVLLWQHDWSTLNSVCIPHREEPLRARAPIENSVSLESSPPRDPIQRDLPRATPGRDVDSLAGYFC